jgi:hypothetical protein
MGHPARDLDSGAESGHHRGGLENPSLVVLHQYRRPDHHARCQGVYGAASTRSRDLVSGWLAVTAVIEAAAEAVN